MRVKGREEARKRVGVKEDEHNWKDWGFSHLEVLISSPNHLLPHQIIF